MMRLGLLIIIPTLMLCPGIQAQTSQQFNRLDQCECFLGEWTSSTDEGRFYETWTRINDTVFSAYSYMTVNNDTVFSETISLELSGDEISYIVNASNQNDGNAVAFKLITVTPNEFIFENKEHDFPQRIIYSCPVTDALYARIEGTVNGVLREEEFPMTRIR
jgi:hypothetical protein